MHKILVVEDESDSLEVLCLLVELLGFIPERAANGIEGIEKAMSCMPSLIITDWMMPLMDGLSMCENLRKDNRTCRIPIILLSAAYEPQSDFLPYNTFISKPVRLDQLEECINIHIGVNK